MTVYNKEALEALKGGHTTWGVYRVQQSQLRKIATLSTSSVYRMEGSQQLRKIATPNIGKTDEEEKRINLRDADLSGLDLSDYDLTKTDLSYTTLSGTVFRDAILDEFPDKIQFDPDNPPDLTGVKFMFGNVKKKLDQYFMQGWQDDLLDNLTFLEQYSKDNPDEGIDGHIATLQSHLEQIYNPPEP